MANSVMEALKLANIVGTAIANTSHQQRLQRAMEKFRQILTAEEFTKLTTTPDAQSFLDFTLEVDGIGKKRKLRRFASSFTPFLESVQRYSLAVEILISSNPKIAALVWGSLKFVIIVALNFSGFFEKLAQMFRAIGSVCPIFRGFQEIFSESSELRESLSDFYALVIEFCTESLQFLKKNSIQQFTGLLWSDPFDFQKFETQLREQQQTITLQQSLASEGAAHNSRLQMSLFRQRGEQHWSDEVLHWAGNEEREIQNARNEKKRVREALLDRVSDYNYRSSLSEACRKRYEGTGQWLFDCPEFQAWIQENESCGLWVHGIPGSGKTVLAAGVVEHLYSLPRGTKTSTKMSISYFFCNFYDRKSREPRTIVSSLVRQILNIFDETREIGESLKAMFVTHHREPNVEELSVLLASVTRLPTTAYLIIDGLDECEDSDRREILSCLTVLIRQRGCRIKIIISSRWMDSKVLECFGQIPIHSPRNCSDIELYIREIIDNRIDDRSIVIRESSMAEEIKQELIRKSDGMFLWVTFQILEISREHTDEGIRAVLRSLPDGLNETYARILERIKRDRKPDVARRIFQWLAVARRPLSLDELAESTALEPGRFFWDERHRPTSSLRLLQDCGNLVTYCTEESIVQFAHSTVLEFLLSPPACTPTPALFFTKLEANLHIAKVCLAYLSFPDFETQLSTIPKETIPEASAMDMTVTEWIPSMVREHRGGRFMWNVARNCYMPRESPRATAAMALPRPRPSESAPSPFEALGRKYLLLDYVSRHWIYHCAKLRRDDESHWRIFADLIFQRVLPFTHLPWKQLGSDRAYYTELLTWAVENGHTSMFNLVIGTIKANDPPVKQYMNTRTVGTPTLLEIACRRGDEELVGIILNEGVDVNNVLNELNGGEALQIAAGGGHLAIVDRLLSFNADVNAIAGRWHGRSALQAAAEGGHLAVVDRLLSSNADVNAKPADGGLTALQLAAERGHLAVVDRLLSSNADINAKPAEWGGRTALQLAAERGHLAVVDRLLSSNADINAKPAEWGGRTALQAAAEGGHLAVVDRLLSSNADVNAKPAEWDGRTALQAAAEGGHLAVVDRLLSSNADINAKPAEWGGRTALQAAAGGGHLVVVDRLLSSNADVNAKPADGGLTALQAAAGGGHLAVVDRLLSSNADVNAKPAEWDGRTALQLAAERGHLAVVDRLLSSNADVNAGPADGGLTALQAAAEGGHLAVVDRLLSSNADINAKPAEWDGRTALQAAAGGGHLAVVDRLLSSNAHVNAGQVYGGLTALQAAAERGHLAVVDLLRQAGGY